MSEEGILIFVVFVGIAFIAVGILGIYKKKQFAKSTRGMRSVVGVLVDYTVAEQRDEDNFIREYRFPVYEYEWEGVTKRLESTTSVSGKKRSELNSEVHILVDPRTEEAICLEDAQTTETLCMIFGVIGVLVLILVLLKWLGILP